MSRTRPKFASIESPWPLESGTVRFLEPVGGVENHHIEQLRRGDPGEPFILEEDGMRHLHFTLESELSLEFPTFLDRLRYGHRP